GGTFFHASGALAPDHTLAAELDGRRVNAIWVRSGEEILVVAGVEAAHRFLEASSLAGAARRTETPERLTSPMPGRIAALLVAPGAKVEANQPVLVLEAMKMEHMLRAPKKGILKDFKFQIGDHVAEGVELATFEAGPPPDSAS
ncbi:MAG: biotin/lipoyl-containing protein, partial [Beijerinckiaceae bacterium]